MLNQPKLTKHGQSLTTWKGRQGIILSINPNLSETNQTKSSPFWPVDFGREAITCMFGKILCPAFNRRRKTGCKFWMLWKVCAPKVSRMGQSLQRFIDGVSDPTLQQEVYAAESYLTDPPTVESLRFTTRQLQLQHPNLMIPGLLCDQGLILLCQGRWSIQRQAYHKTCCHQTRGNEK